MAELEPGWRPLIVDPDRRAAIAAVIVEIVAAVQAWRRDHPASADDHTDYATLRSYIATDDTVPDPEDEAGDALAAAVTAIADRQEPGLYGGVARVAFAVGHLSAGDDADIACEVIERSLLRFLEKPGYNYDLISGIVGIAVPVLQRIADGRPSLTSEPLARAILARLEQTAQPMATGVAWHTPPELLPDWQRKLAPAGYTNLGLAHGVPGVVAILARYITAGVEVPRATALLDRAMRFLHSVAGPIAGSRYAPWLPTHADTPTRVGWCYGDLGVAVAMMSAAAATASDTWQATALELAHGVAARSMESSRVVDAGLCHGAAGVGHMFNRMAQATGDAELERAADAWFSRAIAIRRDGPIAGFPRAVMLDGATGWEPGAELLTGATGVALALHAAISSIEPAWDQLLLADLSPTT